ncbi:MAG: hypothetical protein HY028_01265 [Gammaproteobacteria bacterium]|nr:hypothetical protein [Gammaproteobacteria bacterium]
MEEKHFLEQLGEDLARKLGEAIWAFAKIEWLTYEYIKRLSSEDILYLVGDQNFKPRLKILAKLVEKFGTEASPIEKAKVLISRAEKLSDQRNAIVHNPWQIYVDFEKSDFVTEIYKYTNRQRRFSIEDIESFSREAETVAQNLKAELEALSKSLNRTRDDGAARRLVSR